MPANRDSLDTLETPPTDINAPWEVADRPSAAPVAPPTPANPEEIQRIQVDEEDRLAFRVGVNLITLVLIGFGIYFLARYLWF